VEKRNEYRILVGKPQGTRLFGRRKRKWVCNMKMDFGKIGWAGIYSIDPVEDRDQ
jgi:hypothetical protein